MRGKIRAFERIIDQCMEWIPIGKNGKSCQLTRLQRFKYHSHTSFSLVNLISASSFKSTSLPRRVQNIHHRLLLAHEAVMISMIRGVEIAFAVGAIGSDEAFGVAKAGRRVALGGGVDCSCRHSRRVVISGIYLPWRGSGDVFCVLGRRVVLGSMSVL